MIDSDNKHRIKKVLLAIFFAVMGGLAVYMYINKFDIRKPPVITAPAVPDTATSLRMLRNVAESNVTIKTEQANLKRDEKHIKDYPLESVINYHINLLYRTDTTSTDTSIGGKDSLSGFPR